MEENKGLSKIRKSKRLVLVDGHSILFRAFHAYPPLTTKKGELVNAVYGFTNILLTVIKDLLPTHIAISFDRAAPTFRHETYKGYKAHRPEAPEELIKQQERVEEVVSVLNIPVFALEGYEADDVIGTLAAQASKLEIRKLRKRGLRAKFETIIVTGDRDLLQLVNDEAVKVYMSARGKDKAKIWNTKEVIKKYGLTPLQLVDLKALAGDASDEIPGVRGIGPKTATTLLRKYKTLEGIYRNLSLAEKEFGSAVFRKLRDGKETAMLSKRLAAIVTDVPIRLSSKACEIHDYDKGKAIEKFQEFEFKSLIAKLPNDSFEQMVQEEMFK